MGGIYLITNIVNGMQYIGLAKNIKNRWRCHEYARRKLEKYQNGLTDSCKFERNLLYNAMLEYNIENFTFEIIVDNLFTTEELDTHEIECIKKYNTVKPNGYNSTSGGGHFTHHEDTKKLMSEKAIAAAPSLIDKYRREETKGLPMYIVYHHKGSDGFAICGHPLCTYKSFTLTNHDTMEECKLAAQVFLENLTQENKAIKCNKRNPDLPMGITPFRNGYAAKRKVNGVLHKKAFCDSKKTMDEKLQLAKEFLESIPIN